MRGTHWGKGKIGLQAAVPNGPTRDLLHQVGLSLFNYQDDARSNKHNIHDNIVYEYVFDRHAGMRSVEHCEFNPYPAKVENMVCS